MTTSNSPLYRLKEQADKIAAMLKKAERGERIDVRFAKKIAAARSKPSFKVGIAMDDKIVTIEMPWEIIRETEEAGLSAWIVEHMRGNVAATN